MPDNPRKQIVTAVLAAWLCGITSQADLVPGLKPVDVGSPPLPGSTTSTSPGAFAVTGSGEYKNSGSDNFHFAYTNVTGNFDFQVRVESLEAQSQWSKAGLMVRETTEASVTADLGSRAVTMTAYPPAPSGGNQLILIRREQADAATQDDILGTAPTYPNTWLRLRRLGDTIIGYTGTNGATWDVQGARNTATWLAGPLNTDLLLGLAVASANPTANVTAQLKEFASVPSTNPVAITVALTSVTVNKGKAPTLSVTVSGYDPFYAQWYTNGVPIPGGTNYSYSGTLKYTNAPVSLADDGIVFSVVVSNSVSTVTNANAVLHVVDDNTPPVVTAATADDTGLNVLFNEEVSSATAVNINNYTLKGVSGVDIVDAMLSSNNRLIFLTLNGPVNSTNATLTVAKVQDLVGNTRTQTVPVWQVLLPDNIVASGYPSDRATAFASVTDGVVDAGWQTNGDKDHRPQFAGLIYTNLQTFGVVKVDLGEQNEYGGSFTEEPKLYLLKKNVDTDTTGPESDPANWQEVAAQLVSPNLFDGNVDPSPSPASPIVFDLSALTPGARAGYGWAVGGVRGDNSGFIRVTELRAYGESGGAIESTPPTIGISRTTAGSLVISWPVSAADFVLKSTDTLSSPAWSAVSDPKVVVGDNYTVTVTTTGGTRFYRLEK